MKRRNPRKCDSFDIIKISPKRSSSNVNSIYLRDSQQGTTNLQSSINKQKHYLQLPKIHAQYPQKIKRKQRENQIGFTTFENRLLLLGYQFRRQNQPTKLKNKQSKERDRNDSQLKDEIKQIEIGRKKSHLFNKQNFNSKKIFIEQVLAGFGITEIILEKKKLFVYVEQGNNSRMVKQMLRKRAHLVFVNQKKQANFVWTRFCDYQYSKMSSKYHEQKTTHQNSHSEDQHQAQHHKYLRHFNQPFSPFTPTLAISSTSLIYQQNSKTLIQKQSQPTITSSYHPSPLISLVIEQFKYHNHFTNHYQISDKKSLFSNLQKYCTKNKMNIFDLVPLTFQISKQTAQLPNQIGNQGFWFVKPGEDTNRGNGISIATGRDNIKQEVKNLLKIGKTALIQQYIDPLLYKNRKFDIRCYTLIFCFRGELKAYWYKQGYIRTCSKQFNYDITDLYAHLTNDAIQKKSPLYGKFQQSNKLSFNDLDSYLRTKQLCFQKMITDMKQLVYHSIKSVQYKLKNQKNHFNFEIFGYDFLIDKKGKVWLIQVNTNPCLQFTGSLTSRVIGHMIDNSFKIVIDPFLYELGGYSWKQEHYRANDDNKYQVII